MVSELRRDLVRNLKRTIGIGDTIYIMNIYKGYVYTVGIVIWSMCAIVTLKIEKERDLLKANEKLEFRPRTVHE